MKLTLLLIDTIMPVGSSPFIFIFQSNRFFVEQASRRRISSGHYRYVTLQLLGRIDRWKS